ncbi:MAG TPA: glycine--tRNA ligase subunit beta [Nitrospiria bacterium]|jgi:glycyl-tRNA synthetase beta chain
MSKELFLEIGTEEIPAVFLPPALGQLEKLAETMFQNHRIAFSGLKTLGTPRRLVLLCEDVSVQQTDVEMETLGPARRISYDPQGHPTPAAKGFAKSQGVEVEDLSFKTTEKGEYICVKKLEKGEKTFSLLKTIFPELISSLHFPKSMRWNGGKVRFARPIRWIVALFNDQVVPFSLGKVRAGSFSRGHMAIPSPGKTKSIQFKFKGITQYLQEARKYHVLVDPIERKVKIEKEIGRLTRGGAEVIPDQELLELTTNMVEFPVAIKGGFHREFLELPREVLINAMREHQGYFPIEDPKGKLLPQFISVCDVKASKMNVIRKGNERVLRARLADARFFFKKDRKEGLDKRVDELKGMTFHQGLGTLYEKTQRLQALGEFLANQWDGFSIDQIRRAAFLSKADLRTEMVGEFPKLQGIMGGEYARFQGEETEVYQAISEQYLPGFVGDHLPQTEAGTALAIADKLDSLTGFFGINRAPSGSQDPYGLRRQALGIGLILIGKQKRLSLVGAITEGIRVYQGKIKRPSQELGEALLDFFKQRISYLLTQEGFRTDLVTAILDRCDDPFDARERLIALVQLSRQTGFNELIVAFTRVMNILPKGFEGEVQAERFQDEVERNLFGLFQKTEKTVLPLMDEFKYSKALAELVSLKPFIDTFFEKVLVMDPDPQIRQNRLALMKGLRDLFWLFGNFSKIQQSEGKQE